MLIDKSKQEINELIIDWFNEYKNDNIYGFGMSDVIGQKTFFDCDLSDNELSSEDKDIDNLHLLGFKADTHRKSPDFEKGFRIKAVFDNNPRIQNKSFHGIKVFAPSDILRLKKIKIVVFPRRYYTIKQQLEEYGLVEYVDFMYVNFFIAFSHYFVQNKVMLPKVTSCITTRCTLKCKDCNMFIPYHTKHEDIPHKDLVSDLDLLFSRVDYVQWFTILGGEPLLHRDLNKYIRYLEKYADRIAEIVIDINGSVVPSDSLLEYAGRLGNIRIMVNNYKLGESYNKRYFETVDKLKLSGVSYTLREYEWNLFKRDDAILDSNELQEHYIRCNQPFIAFQNKRLYACHLSWSTSTCGLGNDDPQDYLDFSCNSMDSFDIVKAGLGHLQRGYASLCAVCNGCDPYYHMSIQKAVQI